LARALDGVAQQTAQDVEVIVVENGESHVSEDVVRRFADSGMACQYRYEPVANVANARNVGMRMAQGRYIAFLDDDDEWLPEKLARQVAVLESQPHIDLVSCKARFVDTQGSILGEGFSANGEVTLQTFVEQGCVIPTPSALLLRRTSLQRIGEFRTSMPPVEDYEFYVRASEHCRILCLSDVLYRALQHEGNVSQQHERMWGGTAAVLRELLKRRPSSVSQATLLEAIRRHAQHFYGLGIAAADEGRYQQAMRCLANAIGCDWLVGYRIRWSRSRNPLYRALRPYLALLLFAGRWLLSAGSGASVRRSHPVE
jgi:glycosyltransferase involved in cell wall biosynthesis